MEKYERNGCTLYEGLRLELDPGSSIDSAYDWSI